MKALKKNDFQKLFLSENKQINNVGCAVEHLKSVSGRLIEIKAGLRVQLTYTYKTNDQTKNIPLDEIKV